VRLDAPLFCYAKRKKIGRKPASIANGAKNGASRRTLRRLLRVASRFQLIEKVDRAAQVRANGAFVNCLGLAVHARERRDTDVPDGATHQGWFAALCNGYFGELVSTAAASS